MNTTTVYRHLYERVSMHCAPVNAPLSATRKRGADRICPQCRATLYPATVTFAVVEWRQDGIYRLENAIATYAHESRAESAARAHSDTAVVRVFRIDT